MSGHISAQDILHNIEQAWHFEHIFSKPESLHRKIALREASIAEAIGRQ